MQHDGSPLTDDPYRSIFENAGVGIFRTRLDGTLLRVNPAVARILGYASAAEMRAAVPNVRALYVDPARRDELVAAIRAAGEATGFEVEVRRADGTTGTVSLTVRALRDADGTIAALDGCILDVSVLRRTERELARVNRALRVLSAGNQELVRAGDEPTLLARLCQVVVEAGGYPLAWIGFAEEDEAHTVHAVAQAGDEAGYLRDVTISWADDEHGRGPTGTAIRTGETSVVRDIPTDPRFAPWRDEASRRGYVSSVALPLRSGRRIMGALNVHAAEPDAFDAAELAILEELAADIAYGIEALRARDHLRLVERLEAVGQLAGGVAHDFNNLLMVIRGFSQLVLTDLAAGDPHHGDLSEVVRAADRAAELTHQLLAFSRRQVLRPQVLDIGALLREVEPMLRRAIGEDIELAIADDPALGAVLADPAQLEQVVLNLAVNARDAMPTGGALTIETANVDLDQAYAQHHVGARPGPHVMLAVSDTGIGMDAETQSHIFEPFFTTRARSGGTGLGLATVYGIVKQSGGSIWVYSEPGAGSTFKVYLPRVPGAPDTAAEAADSAPAHRGSETILVVEDEEPVRAFMQAVLERQGYRVLAAGSGSAALELAAGQQGPIDLLLTDVVLPGMGGRELAERLAGDRPELRVLFISGYSDRVVARKGMLAPGAPYLAKPASADTLARKVREVLDAPAGAGEPSADEEVDDA